LGNWLKIGVLVAICLIPLFIFPAVGVEKKSEQIPSPEPEPEKTADDVYKMICLSPDGYCMSKVGMNNPDAYGECLGRWVPFCRTYEAKQGSQTCVDANGEEFRFGKYSPIEDFPLLYELTLQGLTERNLDTSEILVKFKDNTIYETECQTFYKEFVQIRTESERWYDSCADSGEFPNADKIREMVGTFNVCGFATLVPVEQSIEETEIVCGTGTVENEYGQCVLISQTKGGGCLIATATFGSELATQVQMLREIRDNSLLQTQSGHSFMQSFNSFYYSFSPTIADYERQNPVFKEAVKLTITPLVASLSLLNYVDLDSEESVLGYGIGIILMNVGMYFVAPVIVIHRIKKILNS